MADAKISALTTASALAGTEVLPIVQSSTTKKVAVDNLTVKNIRSNATTGLLQIAGPTAAATRTMTVPDANFTAARTDAAQTFTGVQTFDAGLRVVGPTPAFNQGAISSEYPFTRHYTGDGTGYSWAVSKRTGGATVDLLTVLDNTSNVTVNLGSLIIGTAGQGIDFSATSSGSGTMTSELLNDYEEGTWTPTQGAGLVVVGAFTSSGKYTKVGRQVTVSAILGGATSIACTAGGIFTTGLPFTPASTHAGVATSSNLGGTVLFVGTATTYSVSAMAASGELYMTATYSV